MISKIFSCSILTIIAAIKTVLLALILHVLFLPLVMHTIPVHEKIGIELVGIGLLIQIVVFGIILLGVYLIAIILLLTLYNKLPRYNTEKITAWLFPIIAIAYIFTFYLAFMLFERKEIPFIIACSIPHLIAITTGVFLLVRDWKALSESNNPIIVKDSP